MSNKVSNYLQICLSQLKLALSVHRYALLIFPVVATLFLHEVLLSNKSLSAFDVFMAQPSWKSEFEYKGTHELILSDSPTAHYPERKLNWELFKQDHNFNYTPYIFSGTTYTGRKIGAFLTSLPQLVLDTPNAIDWSTWFRMILAGLFMYLLLVSLGIGKTSAIVAGLLWTYNLHQIVWLEFPQHLATQLWMPLLLMLNVQLIRHRVRLDLIIGLLLVNIFFYTSGYTQIVLYYYIFIGLFNTLYIAIDGSQNIAERLKSWALVNGIYIGAVAILIADILFEIADIKTGLRGSQDFRKQVPVLQPSFTMLLELGKNILPDLAELKRFFSPDYLGGIWGKWYQGRQYGNIIEGGNYYGVLGLFLSFYSLTGHNRHPDRRLFYVLLGILLLLIGFYNADPLIRYLFSLIPLAGSGTYSRMITVILMLLCMFAAFGLYYLVQDLLEKKYRKAIIGLLAFSAIPVIARLLDPAEYLFRKFSYSYWILIAFSVLAVAAVIMRRTRLVAWAAILVVTVDLFAVTYDFNTKMRNTRILPENSTIRFLLDDPETFRVAVMADTPIYHHNILSYFYIPTVGGYLTVAPTSYLDYIVKVYGEAKVTLNGILFLFSGGDLEALRLLNVKYVISDKQLDTDKAELVYYNNKNYVYRLQKHLPRAYCASDVISAAGKENTLPTVKKALNTYDRPMVADMPDDKAGKLTTACSIDDLQVYVTKLTFNASADDDTFVIIPTNYHENWRLMVNGENVDLLRVNSIFMGIPIKRGDNNIELVYINKLDVIASSIKIILALLIIILVLTRLRPGISSCAIIAVCGLMIWKDSYSIPGIKNYEILEKPVRNDVTVNDTIGLEFTRAMTKSKTIHARQDFRSQFTSPLHGLRKVKLLLTSSAENADTGEIRIVLRNRSTGKEWVHSLASQSLQGNRWVELPLEEVEQSRNVGFDIEVHGDNATAADGIAVWLDENDHPCIITHHNPISAYRH